MNEESFLSSAKRNMGWFGEFVDVTEQLIMNINRAVATKKNISDCKERLG